MTDHKSWLWRKKSSEKTIIVAEKPDITSKGNEEEIHVLLAEKADLERELEDLNDKLSSALFECSAKDELVKKHAKTAQEALAGWEKAGAKSLSLKQEVNEALKQRAASEEQASQLDLALKECMHQLHFIREEQEQRIHDVLAKASNDFEKIKIALEEKLTDSSIKLAKFCSENSQLAKELMLKKQLIDDLGRQIARSDAEFNSLLAKLETVTKENTSLKYEVRVLEKELDVRNEEKEFDRRTAEASHKQHLENVKKITKLESECQRLRVLVRKRLPGPAAVAKMKNEVQLLERNSSSNRRKKSNSNLSNLQLDYNYIIDSSPESYSKMTNVLNARLFALEEENVALREALYKTINELQISRNGYSHNVLEEASRSQMTLNDISIVSMSDVGSDDKISCSGSWASALISDIKQFRDGKKFALPSESVGPTSDINLMDDFAEMEKLALVCADTPVESSTDNKNKNNIGPLDSGSGMYPSEITGKEIIPIPSPTDSHENGGSLQSKQYLSISRLIEIIEGINLPFTYNNSKTSPGYMFRVFQWKTSELGAILHSFIHTCNDILSGKAGFEVFIEQLTSTLEWIINHCFSLQDVSSMKDSIRKQFDWDESRSESEHEHMALREEIDQLKLVLKNIECSKKEVEEKLQSSIHGNEALANKLRESESTIANLRAELEDLQQSKAMIENKINEFKLMNEDLNLQLLGAKDELDETQQKFSCLEVELESSANHCEEMESRCLDLQLQIVSMKKMDAADHTNQHGRHLQSNWEISEASEKLAECQETIFNLGKQLRALASTTTTTTMNDPKPPIKRSSLLDQMQAEDDSESPKTKENISSVDSYRSVKPTVDNVNGDEIGVGPLAIVTSKKQSGGLWKKLLGRKKKSKSKKMPLPFAT